MYVANATKLLQDVGWHRMCHEMRGRNDISPTVGDLPHPAAPMLNRVRKNGVPCVLTTEPWNTALLDKRFKRGPHKLANEHRAFLQEEFLDFCRKRIWVLLPYDKVRDLPGLRVSPVGVVPRRGR